MKDLRVIVGGCPTCAKCLTMMKCLKNEALLAVGEGVDDELRGVYSCDYFGCSKCGIKILMPANKKQQMTREQRESEFAAVGREFSFDVMEGNEDDD